MSVVTGFILRLVGHLLMNRLTTKKRSQIGQIYCQDNGSHRAFRPIFVQQNRTAVAISRGGEEYRLRPHRHRVQQLL